MEEKKIRVDVAAGSVVRLIRAGNALAQAIGHNQLCPKVSVAIPCTCGEADKQAGALADWLALVREYNAE